MKYNLKALGFVVAAITLGASIAVTSLTTIAAAHENTTGIVKVRHDNMTKIGGHMKVLVEFMKDDVGTTDDVAKSARAIAELASHIPEWFPKGTSLDDIKDQPTGAKPAIWEDFDKFRGVAKQLQSEATKLAEIAESGGDKGAIGQQLGAVGGNGCKTCHKSFRQKLD